MTQAETPSAPCPERLEVLTFRLGETLMAADVEQVLEMLDPDQTRAAGVASGPRADASPIGGPPSRFQSPKVLVLRGRGERRVAIDRPGEILTIPVSSIQPMPGLVAACAGAQPYWGAVVLDGSPVLLVDLDELVPR